MEMIINNILFDIETIKQDTCKHWGMTRNHYNVKVTVNCVTCIFDYYTGIMLSFDDNCDEDCASLLYCIFSDAQAAQMSLDDFASEFGYTKPSELIEIYNGCKINAHRVAVLGLRSDEDITKAIEELQDRFNV